MSKRRRPTNKSRAAFAPSLPIQVSRGNFAPLAKSPDGIGELMLMDDIGGKEKNSVTSAKVRETLRSLGSTRGLLCTINSDGGVITEGMSIYDAIRAYPGSKTGRVEGIAASMASVILQAFDRRIVTKGSWVMIHNPQGGVSGEASDMTRTAALLTKMREDLLDIYEARSGQPRDKIAKMMDDETWMTAEEAVALGFADEVEDSKGVASADALKAVASLKTAKNIPESLRALANQGKSKMTDEEEKALRDKCKALEEENASLKAADEDEEEKEGDKPAHDDDSEEGDDGADEPTDEDDDKDEDEKEEAKAALALVRQITGKKSLAAASGALLAKFSSIGAPSEDRTAAVDALIRAGKLPPAMKAIATKMSPKAFAAFRKEAKVIVPVGQRHSLPKDVPAVGAEQPTAAGSAVLTASEKSFKKATGKTDAQIIALRKVSPLTTKETA